MKRLLLVLLAAGVLCGTATAQYFDPLLGRPTAPDKNPSFESVTMGASSLQVVGDDLQFIDANNPLGVTLSQLLGGAGGLDWTIDQDATDIHIGNIPDLGSLYQPLDADLTTYAGITPSANVQSLLGAINYATIRTLLDLEASIDFYSISAVDAINAAYSGKPDVWEASLDPDNQFANYGGIIPLTGKTSAAFTVSEIYIQLNEDPTTELLVTCYQKATAVNFATGTVIGSGTTTAGILTVNSGFTDATVPAGSKIWCEIGTNPDASTLHMTVKLSGSYD